MVVTCRAQSQESNVPQVTEWFDTHHRVWVGPSGSPMAGLVGGWGLESNLPPCAAHHQHSQDTRNGCVKSPQDGRSFLDA